MSASGCVGSGGSCEGLWCRSVSDTPLTNPGLVMNCKMIHGGWLPLLGLSVSQRGQAVFQDWLPLVPCLLQVSKRPKAPCDLPLPSGCLLGSATEIASASTRLAWDRFSMSHLEGVIVVHQVAADSNLAPVLGLRPFSKSLRVHQGKPPPAWGPRTIVVCLVGS